MLYSIYRELELSVVEPQLLHLLRLDPRFQTCQWLGMHLPDMGMSSGYMNSVGNKISEVTGISVDLLSFCLKIVLIVQAVYSVWARG